MSPRACEWRYPSGGRHADGRPTLGPRAAARMGTNAPTGERRDSSAEGAGRRGGRRGFGPSPPEQPQRGEGGPRPPQIPERSERPFFWAEAPCSA
mmetsp:Transcript_7386/g.17750  ORF Transcript_7386/g.17750 Transcript_7386/m.17750 type:complete len:95 (-) Transcript_7386:496-780(-)